MKKTVLILALSILVSSCSRDNSPTQAQPSTPVVYVGGQEYDITAHDFYPRVWKDGIFESTLVNNTQSATVLDVFVKGNDVYTCGMIGAGNQAHGFIHKNGIPLVVSNNFASIASIYVNGNDVYGVGATYLAGEVILWKNGVETTISPANNLLWIVPSSIFVSGSDVYVCGNEQVGNNYKRKAVMWKNGLKSTLLELNSSIYANDIFVSGTDVYVAMNGRLWKNGIVSSLISSSFNNYEIYATGIFVEGNDVYICGFAGSNSTLATFWKNGVSINLPDGVEANSIFVKNNDVYIVGIGNEPPTPNVGSFDKGIIWKNGVIENTFPHSTLFSVFVN